MTEQAAQITITWNQISLLAGGLSFVALFAYAGLEIVTKPKALARVGTGLKIAALGMIAQVSLLTAFYAVI